jgi:hypothetical protein
MTVASAGASITVSRVAHLQPSFAYAKDGAPILLVMPATPARGPD